MEGVGTGSRGLWNERLVGGGESSIPLEGLWDVLMDITKMKDLDELRGVVNGDKLTECGKGQRGISGLGGT